MVIKIEPDYNVRTYFSVSVVIVKDAKGDGRKDASKVEE